MARSSASPAGSIFSSASDLFHRGTNLTAPGGHRFAPMTRFKCAGDDIIEHGAPEQLACFGVQPPDHPSWTEVTLARAQARYPGWDLTPWRVALGGRWCPASPGRHAWPVRGEAPAVPAASERRATLLGNRALIARAAIGSVRAAHGDNAVLA
jgi:hypothetical protein